jgi:hypothetical protein
MPIRLSGKSRLQRSESVGKYSDFVSRQQRLQIIIIILII